MRNKFFLNPLLVLMGIFLFFTACDPNRVYEKYQKIDKNGWHQDSIADFPVNITDTISRYNLYVNIRNKGSYPNSNLWLFMTISPPKGKSLKDTTEFILADLHGKWVGKGLGDMYDSQHLYKKNIFFPSSGIYHFRIQHGMRETLLSGIRDIGFRVEKTK